MVTVENALEIIQNLGRKLQPISLSTEEALDFVLAEDVFSSIAMPPFPQSAMDGYAVCMGDRTNEFTLIGEVKAGDDASKISLKPNEAIRIFTGAMIPNETLAVVRQEDVVRERETIKVNVEIKPNANIRPVGEQIQKGDLVMAKGTILSPGAIGFLNMLGIGEVSVYKKPKITILTTGNELVKVGEPLTSGKIYESNSGMLKAVLKNYGFEANHYVVRDSFEETKEAIHQAINSNDLVLLTGGISVGDYDFVGKALNDLGVEQGFYKVKQRPGKPLYFGKKNETIVFGLPGNPASVLTSFYMYVLKALEIMTGREEPYIEVIITKLTKSFQKKAGITFFLKGKFNGKSVEILPAQSSAMLSSFIEANCLVKIEENIEMLKENDEVEILIM